MKKEIALNLIRHGIIGLLEDIQSGTDPWISQDDLAEKKQLTDEDVFEWIYHNRNHSLIIITMNGTYTDEFCSFIVDVMESEWYEDKYQRSVTEAQYAIMEEGEWERTKSILMPTWRPQ